MKVQLDGSQRPLCSNSDKNFATLRSDATGQKAKSATDRSPRLISSNNKRTAPDCASLLNSSSSMFVARAARD
jgi:hypothetical protein